MLAVTLFYCKHLCLCTTTKLANRKNRTIDEAGEIPAVLVDEAVHIFEGLHAVGRHVFHHNLGQLKQLAGGVTLGMDKHISSCKKNNVAKHYNPPILSTEGKEDTLNCKFNLSKSDLNRMLPKSY